MVVEKIKTPSLLFLFFLTGILVLFSGATGIIPPEKNNQRTFSGNETPHHYCADSAKDNCDLILAPKNTMTFNAGKIGWGDIELSNSNGTVVFRTECSFRKINKFGNHYFVKDDDELQNSKCAVNQYQNNYLVPVYLKDILSFDHNLRL
jgi:hypothetical protein